MANWNIALFTKWQSSAGRNDMSVAVTYPASWTDLGQQTDAAIQARGPNFCTMAHGLVNDATLALIQADTHYLLLVRWEETAQGVEPSFDNRQSIVTLAQKNAFVAFFLAEYGIAVGKIPSVANSVGQTRAAVLRDIVQDLRQLT